MISVDKALAIVLERISSLGAETVALEDALGRILAEDIFADMDLPPFDRARMDGYGVRASDVENVPVCLRVIGEVAAGNTFDGEVRPGEAVKIFTGAPIPQGADAVQKVEVTEAEGHNVIIKEPVKPGQFITPHASEAAAGNRVAKSGQKIGPAEMSVLASFGYARVTVGRRPRIAVLSTGSELVEVSALPAGAQIRNSNTYTIASYARQSGAIVDSLGTIEDTTDASCRALLSASKDRDMVVTSGGVSMGDYDLVKAALHEIGAEVYFDRVNIRPGKPTVFARREGTLFFCLPGNPVSTSVTFNVFVRPAIRKMQGEMSPLLPVVQATLAQPLRNASNRRSYLPACLYIEDGRALAMPLKWGGSSDFVAFMRANSLIVVPEGIPFIPKGDMVSVMVLGDL